MAISDEFGPGATPAKGDEPPGGSADIARLRDDHRAVLEGSTVLPIGAVKSEERAPASIESRPQSLEGSILIMDDEEVLLDIAGQMCRRLGLQADSVLHGTGAIERYREAFKNGHPYDAVLLDMTIAGGIGGIETARALRKIDPKVKCIVMSGYSDHEVMSNPEKFGFVAVVSKPFRLNDFGKVLSEVIWKPDLKNEKNELVFGLTDQG